MTRIKKQIIYKSQSIDGDLILKCIEEHGSEVIQKIGAEFFYLTARKFAKSQPIEKYSHFLRILRKEFPSDYTFYKCFLTPDRDYNEVLALLECVGEWERDVNEVKVFLLERFAIYGNFNDFLEILKISKINENELRDLFVQ